MGCLPSTYKRTRASSACFRSRAEGRFEVCPFASFLLGFLPFLSSLPSPTPPLFVCFTSVFLSLLCSIIIISRASVYSAHRPVTSKRSAKHAFSSPSRRPCIHRRRRGPSMSRCAMPYATRRRCRRLLRGHGLNLYHLYITVRLYIRTYPVYYHP
ncbi:hypothetical protein B0H17DRAFT_419930 [Mycena rosella]|uniref:Uncharacterized protein n=1 Tax=Mycena rosella TaxID=1033263 RepID=A0AAD7CHW2_MYCRO|nr:hypothetical protein B0H17DRAFT_419930 [Mycena rosella]